MKFLFVLLVLSGCASREPYIGEYWVCNALSEKEETHKRDGHWGRCQGSEWCAREEALKHCLWRHPHDCEVTACVKAPDIELVPKPKTDAELLEETDPSKKPQ